MTQDRPTATELVAAVREFLERDVMAATEGRVQFHTRVAINALGMVERELTDATGFAADERARAAALLDIDGNTEEPAVEELAVEELERVLASAIRRGDLDDRPDALRDHLRATVREKLLVANPAYLAPRTPGQ